MRDPRRPVYERMAGSAAITSLAISPAWMPAPRAASPCAVAAAAAFGEGEAKNLGPRRLKNVPEPVECLELA